MSYIKLTMNEEKDTGDINVHIKAECSLLELEAATTQLMGALVAASTTGLQVVQTVVKSLEEGYYERTDDTEEHH